MAKKRQPDLRKLARRQRWIIWLVLASLLTVFLPYLVSLSPLRGYPEVIEVIGLLLQLAITLLLVLGVIRLLTAQGNHPIIVILCALVMFAPCGNILMLLFVNSSVTRTLRRAGLKVGFLGVDPQSVERVLNPNLCSKCGYDLTGNVSGRCPECGWEVAHGLEKFDQQWDEAFQRSQDRLKKLGDEALREHRAGRSVPLDPDGERRGREA